jgi:hypothetical protein
MIEKKEHEQNFKTLTNPSYVFDEKTLVECETFLTVKFCNLTVDAYEVVMVFFQHASAPPSQTGDITDYDEKAAYQSVAIAATKKVYAKAAEYCHEKEYKSRTDIHRQNAKQCQQKV